MPRTHVQPDASKQAPAHTAGSASLAAHADDGDTRKRWRTVFVDGTVLEANTPAPGTAPGTGPGETPLAELPLRVVARLDDEVAGVRKNVQDSARAVLAWVSAVVSHEGKTDLDDILDRCLRPGPDIERVNYAAMAEDIFRVTGVELTAKRVQTAVSNLRLAHQNKAEAQAAAAKPDVLSENLQSLDARLRENFAALTAEESTGRETVRRAIGTEVLTAVRCAAGRVIDRDFGEGIPDSVDLEALEGRFLNFVRDTLRTNAPAPAPGIFPGITEPSPAGRVIHPGTAPRTFGGRAAGLEHDLRRLLITLADHDVTAEADMKLVMHGAAVVSSLLGVDSLPGVMAHLNVLVSGRGLIDTDVYVAEMIRLGDLAESLRDDAATRTYMNWVRRLPEDQRLPSPIRVSSYCRSNAATRLFDRLFTGELAPEDPAMADALQPQRTYLKLACDTHDKMLARDGGFTLTLTTETLRHVVVAHLTQDDADAKAYVESLGPAKALDRLEALIKFENNDELVAQARKLITTVFPELRRQLVCVR